MILKKDISKKFDIPRAVVSYHWKKDKSLVKAVSVVIDGKQFVNEDHPVFQAWLLKVRTNTQKKPLVPQATGLENEVLTLAQQAQIATYQAQIHEAEIKKNKAELGAIDLLEKRNNLISTKLAEFYFLGYLDKINIDIFRSLKKFEKFLVDKLQYKVDVAILHRIVVDFKQLYNNEIESVIRSIKIAQQKELEEWKQIN